MDSKGVAEIKRHISVVVEDVQSKMKLIAEGVSALDDRMGRVETGLERVGGRLDKVEVELSHVRGHLNAVEERIERGFAETQAMIKFSYAELDRRVSSLESVVADLASRVQKLEVQ